MNWDTIVGQVSTLITDGAPVAESLLPAWAPAIQLGAKLLSAAANAEPTAVAIVKGIQAGTPPTAAELQSFAGDYEAAYQALHTDIAAQIAAAPVPPAAA